jgi:hypothetical protein
MMVTGSVRGRRRLEKHREQAVVHKGCTVLVDLSILYFNLMSKAEMISGRSTEYMAPFNTAGD